MLGVRNVLNSLILFRQSGIAISVKMSALLYLLAYYENRISLGLKGNGTRRLINIEVNDTSSGP